MATANHRTHDAVIIGGGHNGLVAAAYLARAGLKVVGLERRHVLGGAAGTAAVAPGPGPARSARMAPRRTSRPLLQRPLPGAAGGVHPAYDDERRRLPRPVVRDGSAEGDDERLRDHRHVPGDPLSGDRLRPTAPL